MSRRPKSSTEDNRRRPSRNEPIQEQCPPVQCPRIVEEEESDMCERYDPKELRDAAKAISPFLKLLDERQNPYARIVAREMCKIFYAVYYPNTNPCNIAESLKPILKSVKSTQTWAEFDLYLDPRALYKEWMTLCPPKDILNMSLCPSEIDCIEMEEEECLEISQKYPVEPLFDTTDQRPTSSANNVEQNDQRQKFLAKNVEQNNQCQKFPIGSTDTNKQKCLLRESTEYSVVTNNQNCSKSQDRCQTSSSKSGTNEHQCSQRQSTGKCGTNEQQCLPIQSPECAEVTNSQNGSKLRDRSQTSLKSGTNELQCSQSQSPAKSGTNEHQCSPRRASRLRCSDMFRNRSEFEKQSPRDDNCDYQFAGSDALPTDDYVHHSQTDFGKTAYSSSKYTSEEETDRTYSESMSEDSFGESEVDDIALMHAHSNRQYAGNDEANNCDLSSANLPPMEPTSNYVENPASYKYYSVIANSGSGIESQYGTPTGEMSLRTDVLQNSLANGKAWGSVAVNPEIICNANVVADAFTNISVAQQELDKKKKEFTELTENLLATNSAGEATPYTSARETSTWSNDKEATPWASACSNADNQATNMPSKTSTPRKLMPPFNDSEWNYNVFTDRDFVKLLPFYEIVHNQLEYISRRQRDYGVNMLDDIMPVFYHIHYDLGDPRLKNELLLEHVKLITKNTWEAFFYPRNKKMPAIPKNEQTVNLSRFRPNAHLEQHLSPRQLDLRSASPKPPNQIPPILNRAKCLSSSPQLDPYLNPKVGPSRADTGRRSGNLCPERVAGPSRPDTSIRPTNLCPKQETGPFHADKSKKNKNPCPEQVAGLSHSDSSKRNRNLYPDQVTGLSRTNTSKRPKTGRTPDVPQQTEATPVIAKKSFLRRSQPSGAPKTWAPKLKAPERPTDTKVFKAKPLPKFVRDRLNSRDEPC